VGRQVRAREVENELSDFFDSGAGIVSATA